MRTRPFQKASTTTPRHMAEVLMCRTSLFNLPGVATMSSATLPEELDASYLFTPQTKLLWAMGTCKACGDPATKELNGASYCADCWDELANGKITPLHVARLPAPRAVPKPPSMVREWEEAQWYSLDNNPRRKERDVQRLAVYRWEWAVEERWPECNSRMDLRTCEKLVHRVWQDYRLHVQPPEVKSGRSRRVAWGGRWTIMLPPWACTKLVVLHETAHSLQRLPMGHGPEFARFLADLWEHYAGVPSSMALPLGLAVRPRQVRFASYTDIPTRAACVPSQPMSTANATTVVATACHSSRP